MNADINISFRKAEIVDHSDLEGIRVESFSPIFASFRRILGDEIYELAQKREDEDQSEILNSMFSQDSNWKLYVAVVENEIVGFISFQINLETKVGELGLNAVKPSYAGKGIGTKMYDFANAEMKSSGMRVATVGTGADESHTPARRAYEKAGYNVQIPSVWLCRTL